MDTPPVRRQDITAAVNLSGFDSWKSPLDSSQLKRPATRPSHLPGCGRQAAVMMVLVASQSRNSDASPDLLLIRRSEHLRYHAGQIALPGGRQEPNEPLLQTAIRETEEEIGVSIQDQDIVGSLRSIYIPPSDFTLTPFVAWLDQEPNISIQIEEVESLITLPLASLTDPGAQTTARVVRDNGETIEAPCYRCQDTRENHVVWGATALVISELIARLNALAL